MATLKLPKGSQPKSNPPPKEASDAGQKPPTDAKPVTQHKQLAGA